MQERYKKKHKAWYNVLGLVTCPSMATHSSILTWRIPMDRGAWRATIHMVAESDKIERLSIHTYIHIYTHKDHGDS